MSTPFDIMRRRLLEQLEAIDEGRFEPSTEDLRDIIETLCVTVGVIMTRLDQMEDRCPPTPARERHDPA